MTNAEGKKDSLWEQQASYSLLGFSFHEGVSMQLPMLSLFNHYPIFVKSRVLSSMSQSVAHFQIFRRLMKGKFDAYVLVDRSTICNFTVPTLATTIII